MKVRHLDLSDSPANAEHAALGLPPLETAVTHGGALPAAGMPVQGAAATLVATEGAALLRVVMWSVVALLLIVTFTLGTKLFGSEHAQGASGLTLVQQALSSREFWAAVAVGLFEPPRVSRRPVGLSQAVAA
jgi:uncharacterized protein